MKLPKYHETFIPILKVLAEEGVIYRNELTIKVRDKFYNNLSDDLLNQKVKSGGNRLLDRIGWGISYLKMGKLIYYPERGLVEITEKGKEIFKTNSFTIQNLEKDKDYITHLEKRKKQQEINAQTEERLENDTPHELIENGFLIIESQVKAELLDKLKIINPYYFEKIVLILLNKMGYGAFEETSKSNDGGIDGVINEDKLGLSKIYIQAKRYSTNKVTEMEIRNFIGAMSGDTQKGVFITTSDFNDKAKNKASNANHKIILINGDKLVDLMFEYNVGTQVKNIYEVKELDNDFFEY